MSKAKEDTKYQVFKIENIHTGEMYIGYSVSASGFWHGLLENQLYANSKIAMAVDEYFPEAFEIEVLEEVIGYKQAFAVRNEYIDRWDTRRYGYNEDKD